MKMHPRRHAEGFVVWDFSLFGAHRAVDQSTLKLQKERYNSFCYFVETLLELSVESTIITIQSSFWELYFSLLYKTR